jgi:hypothetical protein
MTLDETAEHLGISRTLVKREWVVARAWLKRELGGVVDEGEEPEGEDAPDGA